LYPIKSPKVRILLY